METFLHFQIDNDRPEHRQILIKALCGHGFEAYEYHSGGGLMHVVVDLYADRTGTTGDILQIATGNIDSPCSVSLMGWRNGSSVQNHTWIRVTTLQDATDAFSQYWSEREDWIRKFDSGNLDV